MKTGDGLAAVGLVLALASERDASAQSSNRLAAVGGRTTLVGGTGLIFGHDSASTFLNPAPGSRSALRSRRAPRELTERAKAFRAAQRRSVSTSVAAKKPRLT